MAPLPPPANGVRLLATSVYAGHRERLVSILKERDDAADAAVLLAGGREEDTVRANTDHEEIFRQESYFGYLFGSVPPDAYGLISLVDGTTTLFIKQLPAEYAVWMGKIDTCEEVASAFGVENCQYAPDIPTTLREKGIKKLFLLHGKNSDSGLTLPLPSFDCFDGWRNFNLDKESLYPIVTELRVHKSLGELEAMRYVNRVSSAAHVEVMRVVKPGMFEYELEAEFKYRTYKVGGARWMSYTPICASGPNGAVLHYGHAGAPNDRKMSDGEMVLLDMGAEHALYASDITITIPVNGKFTADQTIIYESVLDALRSVTALLKPGLEYESMHLLAETKILEGLKAGGLLQGDVFKMMEVRLGAVFMPHGLGHLLGIDTHDVGGYVAGGKTRSSLPGLKNLRLQRKLEVGMVLTVEPGCYFNPVLLDAAYQNTDQSPFMVKSEIDRFLTFGGVRLEDNILITTNGCENLTNVPRSVADVEAVMAGKEWPVV